MQALGLLAACGLFAIFLADAQAAGRPVADPDWPCQQAKVTAFPLASVWDGPAIDADLAHGRDDSEIAALAAQMSQRRVPIGEVETALAKLAAGGPEAKEKIKAAFGAAFASLVRQRGEIIDGLDRFGAKQREMAERIRAENETAHKGDTPDEAALQKLQWDLRLYDDRRRTIGYVCEAPQAIEARIGALVKAVRAAL